MPTPMQMLGREIGFITREATKAANRSAGARKGWETRRSGIKTVKPKATDPTGYYTTGTRTGRHTRHFYDDIRKARASAQRQMTLKMKNGEFVLNTPDYGNKALELKKSILAFNAKVGGGAIREAQIRRMNPDKLYFMMTREKTTLDVFFAYSPDDEYNIEQVTNVDWLIERYNYYTEQGWM